MIEAPKVRYILIEANTGFVFEGDAQKILKELLARNGKYVIVEIVEGEHVSVQQIEAKGITLFVRAE